MIEPWRSVPLLLVLLLASGSLLAGHALAAERVSVASDGTQGDEDSECPAISADGRFVAFVSQATNLIAGDTNGSSDVFIHDRETGLTERVTVATDGTQSDPVEVPSFGCPAISADGRFVAFAWDAANLASGDTNGKRDIFVRDRVAGTTERVSIASDGTQADGRSTSAAISADGRFVAFHSIAANLVAGDTNGKDDAFVRDRLTGTTERVSLTDGDDEADGDSTEPVLSSDGRWVAFTSSAENLVMDDTNGALDVFVRDRQTATTVRVSVAGDGTEANGSSANPAISGDGRFVAFDSRATNLAPGDTNLEDDVFLHDLVSGTTERVSVGSNGAQGDSISLVPALSRDGRFVAFASLAATLVPGDTNAEIDIFVRDRLTGTTTRVSVAADGAQGNGSSGGFDLHSISADGLWSAYRSEATNLVADDTNEASDALVSGIAPGTGSRFEYSAKFVCGLQPLTAPFRLAPGLYVTSINVHNPNRGQVELFKKLALAYPPGNQVPGEVLPIAIDQLAYDQALVADCTDLDQRLFAGLPPVLYEGFVVLQSTQRLDVTAVYTTSAVDADGAPADHSSIDVEQIRERDLGVDLRLDKASTVFDFPLTVGLTLYAIRYTLTIDNVGDRDATALYAVDEALLETANAIGAMVVVDDPVDLPPAASILNITPAAIALPGEPATVGFDLALGHLAAGDSVSAQVWFLAIIHTPFTPPSPASARLKNAATVASQEPETSPSNNTGDVEDVLSP